MPVRVDEPGHERAPAAGDDLGRGAAVDRDSGWGDLLDRVAADENVDVGAELPALAVEDTNVLEQRACGWLGRVRGEGETKHGGKGRSPAKHRVLLSRSHCARLTFGLHPS